MDANGVIKMLDVLYLAQYAEGLINEIPTVAPTAVLTINPTLTPTVPPTAGPTCGEFTDVTVYGYVYKSGNPLQGVHVILESGEILYTDTNGYYSFTIDGSTALSSVTFTVEYVNQWPVTRTVVNPGCGSVEAVDVYYNRQELTGELPGDIWFEQYEQMVVRLKPFITTILMNSGSQRAAAYLLSIIYDPSKISQDADIIAEEGGFITSINPGSVGRIVVAGFDVFGKDPLNAARFLTTSWRANTTVLFMIEIDTSELLDKVEKPIYPRGYTSWIRVVNYGDVNADDTVDIVDALLIAQKYVGLITTFPAEP